MDNDKPTGSEIKFNYFKTFRRIALIFFLAFSIYLVISTIVLVFLTKPSKEIKIPDVVGKRVLDVHNGIVRKGLRLDIKFVDVFDIDDGMILSQYPEVGKVVNDNSYLKLTVSRSKINVEVPNLVGIELPVALNKLKNLHAYGKAISIAPGIISYIESENKADNIVIGQNPKPGEIIAQDRKVNLLVSAGNLKGDSRMPDVMGQSIDLCYDLLLSKGLEIKEEIVETPDKKLSGTIISQTPQKNNPVKKGDSAVIKILWHSIKEHPYISYEKVDYVIPSDQKPGLFEAIVEDNLSKRVRFANTMKPGDRISFIFHRVGNAKIFVNNNKKNIRVLSIDVEEF